MKLLTTVRSAEPRKKENSLSIWSARLTTGIITASRGSLNPIVIPTESPSRFLWSIYDISQAGGRGKKREGKNERKKARKSMQKNLLYTHLVDTCFTESMKSHIHSPEVLPSSSFSPGYRGGALGYIDFVLALVDRG